MTLVTDRISVDEKAHWLIERALTPYEAKAHGCLLVNSLTGVRRYQVITVYRNDRKANYWVDMGPVEDHPYPAVSFPSYGEWRVGDLLEFADTFRAKHGWELQILADAKGESTLAQRFQDFEEARSHIIANRSLFGPVYKQPRNGFARSK